MGGRGEIWLGDLLRAFDVEPGASAETRRAIAEALGFDLPEEGPPTTFAASAEPHTPQPGAAYARLRRHDEEPQASPRGPRESELPTLTASGSRQVGPAPWQRATPLPHDLRTRSARPEQLLRPLLPPTAARAAMADVASEIRAIGPVDVARLVRSIALLRPTRQVPRGERSRLLSTVWFVRDVGPASAPFQGDQQFVFEQLVGLVGEAGVLTRDVLGDPNAIEWTSQSGAVPAEELVLAFTDLGAAADGIQRAATAEAWARFARRLNDASSSLVVLNPFPPKRWPDVCRGVARIVHLDRRVGPIPMQQVPAEGAR